MTLPKETFDEFVKLACALSPENLTHDGELPRKEVILRMMELQDEWAKLEKQVGRKVTENEIWTELVRLRK